MIDKESALTIIAAIVESNYPNISRTFSRGYYSAITTGAEWYGKSFHYGVIQLLVGNHDTPERKYGMRDAVVTTERIFLALGRQDEIHAWAERQRPEDIAGLNGECTCQPVMLGR